MADLTIDQVKDILKTGIEDDDNMTKKEKRGEVEKSKKAKKAIYEERITVNTNQQTVKIANIVIRNNVVNLASAVYSGFAIIQPITKRA